MLDVYSKQIIAIRNVIKSHQSNCEKNNTILYQIADKKVTFSMEWRRNMRFTITSNFNIKFHVTHSLINRVKSFITFFNMNKNSFIARALRLMTSSLKSKLSYWKDQAGIPFQSPFEKPIFKKICIRKKKANGKKKVLSSSHFFSNCSQ